LTGLSNLAENFQATGAAVAKRRKQLAMASVATVFG